jgi:cytochrome c oxidase assembly protein subunit 15
MPSDERSAGRLSILTVGFGTTVAMWAVGYVCRIPPALVPAPLVLILMLACLVLGGVALGRYARAGVAAGACAGAVSAVVNLLILGAVIADLESDAVPSALIWGPGSIVGSAVACAIGAWVGSRLASGSAACPPACWRSGFGFVACLATLLAVIAGGLVTSTETGMAVPDWPNTFGTNMFLYPLSKMTGGIYFEHAHRLYGALVGLTTIVLAVVIWCTDERRWLRWLSVLAIGMVIGQGVMGGLRVTETNVPLAIAHGVFGQIFFVVVALIWAFTTAAWREGPPAVETESAATERTLTATLVAALVPQVIFGAMYRHLLTDDVPLPWPAHAHLTLAAIVTVLAAMAGLRAWAKYPEDAVLRRHGVALLCLIGVQLLLGLAALIAVLAARGADPRPAYEVVLATAHQANGAIVLATSVLLAAWVRRRLV